MASKSTLALRLVYRTDFSLARASSSGSDKARQRIGHSAQSGDSGQADVTKQVAGKIAIVEDDEGLCSLFSTLVKSLGYRVEFVAHNGAEIVRAVSEDSIQPDLIIMDYRMPVMNGMQAAKEILRVSPDIKIILATADDSVTLDANSAGILFVQKPFSIRLLAKTLEDALR